MKKRIEREEKVWGGKAVSLHGNFREANASEKEAPCTHKALSLSVPSSERSEPS